MRRLIVRLLVLASIVGLAGCSHAGVRPYRALTAADISSAAVLLQPPGRTLPIEDTGELVALLKDVVVCGAGGAYPEYAGQAVTFYLIMSDGTQTGISVCSPFLVVDGVGYRAGRGPCEALSSYANGLLSSGAGGPPGEAAPL